MRNNLAGLLAAILLLAGAPASTAADKAESDGVVLSLVAEPPDARGRFRAALLVELKPGWKTYWLDPGEAGIRPTLRFDPGANATASFPAPHRFDDGFAKSIVYSAPFAIALEGESAPGATELGVKATLGLCRDICIPVSADLSAPFLASAAASGAVDAAFAALPKPSTASAGIVAAKLAADASALTVLVRPASAGEGADLFVAGPDGWTFGTPRLDRTSGSEAELTLPVTAKPRKATTAPFAVDAVLSGPGGAWRAGGLTVERER